MCCVDRMIVKFRDLELALLYSHVKTLQAIVIFFQEFLERNIYITVSIVILIHFSSSSENGNFERGQQEAKGRKWCLDPSHKQAVQIKTLPGTSPLSLGNSQCNVYHKLFVFFKLLYVFRYMSSIGIIQSFCALLLDFVH